jgi:hypothetical protein
MNVDSPLKELAGKESSNVGSVGGNEDDGEPTPDIDEELVWP